MRNLRPRQRDRTLLMEAIERLRGKHTIILVAHRLSTVRNCHQIVFLEQGKMTGLGDYSV
jgi:ATP-binding cassette, subfamily B, bacterial PglK